MTRGLRVGPLLTVALAGQAIVFARLAGFLAAQFPPDADLFRMVTGAIVDGHSEPAALR